jgi:hypothetical protein
MLATKLSKVHHVGEERYQEAYKPIGHDNIQEHTIRAKTLPYTRKARSCTRMPSAERLVRAAARTGSSRNLCVRRGGPLQR